MATKILSKRGFKIAPRNKPKKKLFSQKELPIIKLICQELNSSEIGEELNTTARAIQGYREDIMIKTESKNVVGIVKYAIKNKIYKL